MMDSKKSAPKIYPRGKTKKIQPRKYCVEECLPSLIKLGRCDKHQRKLALLYAPDRLINGLSECSMNVLYGRVPLNEKQRNYLRLYKNLLRRAADPKLPVAERRRVFQQRGGALVTTLLSLALPYVIDFAAKKIFKKKEIPSE